MLQVWTSINYVNDINIKRGYQYFQKAYVSHIDSGEIPCWYEKRFISKI